MICVKMIRLAFGGSGGNDIVLKHNTYQSINILNGKYGDSNILSEFTHYYKNVVQPNTLNIDEFIKLVARGLNRYNGRILMFS